MISQLPLNLFFFFFSATASEDLLKAVGTELKLVNKDFHQLPVVTAFDCTTDGAVATLRRQQGNEEIVVTLDANNAVDLEDSMGDDFSNDPDVSCCFVMYTVYYCMWQSLFICMYAGIPIFQDEGLPEDESVCTAPAFTVTITKPSVSVCYFTMYSKQVFL